MVEEVNGVVVLASVSAGLGCVSAGEFCCHVGVAFLAGFFGCAVGASPGF